MSNGLASAPRTFPAGTARAALPAVRIHTHTPVCVPPPTGQQVPALPTTVLVFLPTFFLVAQTASSLCSFGQFPNLFFKIIFWKAWAHVLRERKPEVQGCSGGLSPVVQAQAGFSLWAPDPRDSCEVDRVTAI